MFLHTRSFTAVAFSTLPLTIMRGEASGRDPTEEFELNLLTWTWKLNLRSTKQLSMDGKLDLAKAVINRLGALDSEGFDIFLHTDAPPGSGLGSSSALVVTLVGLIREYKNMPLDSYDVARTAYVVEREDLKISGGLQDQYADNVWGLQFH